jgi:hypothetical protein
MQPRREPLRIRHRDGSVVFWPSSSKNDGWTRGFAIGTNDLSIRHKFELSQNKLTQCGLKRCVWGSLIWRRGETPVNGVTRPGWLRARSFWMGEGVGVPDGIRTHVIAVKEGNRMFAPVCTC